MPFKKRFCNSAGAFTIHYSLVPRLVLAIAPFYNKRQSQINTDREYGWNSYNIQIHDVRLAFHLTAPDRKFSMFLQIHSANLLPAAT